MGRGCPIFSWQANGRGWSRFHRASSPLLQPLSATGPSGRLDRSDPSEARVLQGLTCQLRGIVLCRLHRACLGGRRWDGPIQAMVNAVWVVPWAECVLDRFVRRVLEKWFCSGYCAVKRRQSHQADF